MYVSYLSIWSFCISIIIINSAVAISFFIIFDFILYIKGSKQKPECKYSRLAVEKLNTLNIEYNTYDILKNNELRERLKTLKCKTYPQLWFKSKYICNGDTIKNKDNLMELLDTFN